MTLIALTSHCWTVSEFDATAAYNMLVATQSFCSYSLFLQEEPDNCSVISDASLKGTLCDIRYRNGRIIRIDSDIDEDEERVYLFESLLGNYS